MVTSILRDARLSAQRAALLSLSSLAGRLDRSPRRAEHLATGLRGELEAFFYLRRQGYTVVARRWRTAELRGDLDLIAWEGDTLCFIEVKARTARDLMPAESAVDREKRSMLRQMARAYLRRISRQQREAIPVRFDLVSVYLLRPTAGSGVVAPEFELFRDAFGWR